MENSFKELACLCECNNCGTIMIDENPQVGAKQYMVDVTKVPDMNYKTNIVEHEEHEHYWVCPICDTDEYLKDDIDETKLNELI